MQEAPSPSRLPCPPAMLKTSRYLTTGYVQSQERKNQLCAARVCVCTLLWPLFHLHVWCSCVAAGEWRGVEGGGGGGVPGQPAKPGCSCFARRGLHRLRSPLNPLSCSEGRVLTVPFFHPLSPNPAGCGSGGNNPGLGTPPYEESVGGPTMAGVPHPLQSAAPGAPRLSRQPIH